MRVTPVGPMLLVFASINHPGTKEVYHGILSDWATESGVETCIQHEPFIPQSGDRLTIFCFLFRFSGGQPDWPTSFKHGLAYFHQRVVNVLRVVTVARPLA